MSVTVIYHQERVGAAWWGGEHLPLQGLGAWPLPPLFFGPGWWLWWSQGQSTPGLQHRDAISLATSARHGDGK